MKLLRIGISHKATNSNGDLVCSYWELFGEDFCIFFLPGAAACNLNVNVSDNSENEATESC